MARRRFVIVGASLAGGTAAAALREEGFDGDICLIGAEPHVPYNRPPLSKGYLRGQERFDDQLVKPPAYYEEHGIELRLGTRATAIDPARKLVEVEGGEQIAYDRLLVATGGRNRELKTAREHTGRYLSVAHGGGLRSHPGRDHARPARGRSSGSVSSGRRSPPLCASSGSR